MSEQYGPTLEISDGLKRCCACSEVKSILDFHRSSKSGTVSRCKPCAKQYAKDYRLNNPELAKESVKRSYNKNKHKYTERYRNNRLKREYNITQETYSKMLEDCDGQCEICGTSYEVEMHNVLIIDHCHNSNQVRGLLCRQCNIGLGAFKDNIDNIQKSIDYLRKYNGDRE